MKNVNQIAKQFTFGINCATCLSIGVLFLSTILNQAFADRFSAPDLVAPIGDFEQRLNSGDLNVDFIVALTFNKARKIEREVEEFVEKTNTQLFSNINKTVNNANNNIQDGFSTNSAIASSVIIPPGTKADTIIIININDGDSFAIRR